MDRDSTKSKKERLVHKLRGIDSLVIAFSGGVDSSLLLAVAHETLGKGAVAATATSEIYSVREKDRAIKFGRDRGIEHIVFHSHEASLPAFVSNGPERCYHCKKSLFQDLVEIAASRGIEHVGHGANVDDLDDYRPGFRAAAEMGIMAPLLDAGLKKQEIRSLSREIGLDTWDKPAMACLATRIPYGNPITSEKLRMIEEAETFLLERGFGQCRVRHHGSVARIEVESQELKMMMPDDVKKAIVAKFRDIGFCHISVDLEGYVSGSMNRVLNTE